MQEVHKKFLFIQFLLLIIMTTILLLSSLLKVMIPLHESYSVGYLGGILDFPQPFVKGRKGFLRGPGTLCSKDSCITESCRIAWENDSYEDTNYKSPSLDYNRELDDERKCKNAYYTKFAIRLIIVILLLIMQIYLLYSISKGKLHLLTVSYSIILTSLYLAIAVAGAAGKGPEGTLEHIWEKWAVYNNTLFSLYIIIYYIFFRNK